MIDYIRDGQEIYRNSFRIIREEARLERIPADLEKLAVRVIHACGMVEAIDGLQFSAGAGHAGREALRNGAPILCDAQMVASGIIRSRLPADNRIVCHLGEPGLAPLAAELGTTKTAAAVELWKPLLQGAVVAIGNAPTALVSLEALMEADKLHPALIIGVPVGFVNVVESKELVIANCRAPYIVARGRKGGSNVAAAICNAMLYQIRR